VPDSYGVRRAARLGATQSSPALKASLLPPSGRHVRIISIEVGVLAIGPLIDGGEGQIRHVLGIAKRQGWFTPNFDNMMMIANFVENLRAQASSSIDFCKAPTRAAVPNVAIAAAKKLAATFTCFLVNSMP
jgi:hypothetical protein